MIAQADDLKFDPSIILIVAIIVLLFFALLVFFLFFGTARLWLRGFLSHAQVSLIQLIAMRLRKVDANVIMTSRIMSVQAGHPIPVNELEVAFLSGANVPLVTQAYVDSNKSGKDFTFEELVDADLSDTLAKLLNK